MDKQSGKVKFSDRLGNIQEVERHRVCYGEPKGFSWNPLKQWPRNMECFCGSKKKFKKCCAGRVKDLVTVQEAAELKGLMKEYLDNQKTLDNLKKDTPQ